jgi:hypothetical protein
MQGGDVPESGITELVTTDRLSPNMWEVSSTGAPRCLSGVRNPCVCWMAVFAEVNSDPWVVVSTVDCFLENQSMGVLLMKCRTPVMALPVHMS